MDPENSPEEKEDVDSRGLGRSLEFHYGWRCAPHYRLGRVGVGLVLWPHLVPAWKNLILAAVGSLPFFVRQSMSAMIRIQWFPLLNYHQGILMYAAGNSELETLGQLDEATWNVPQSRIHQKFGCRKNRQVSRRGKRGEHGPWHSDCDFFVQRTMLLWLLYAKVIFIQRMYGCGCLVHGWRV